MNIWNRNIHFVFDMNKRTYEQITKRVFEFIGLSLNFGFIVVGGKMKKKKIEEEDDKEEKKNNKPKHSKNYI